MHLFRKKLLLTPGRKKLIGKIKKAFRYDLRKPPRHMQGAVVGENYIQPRLFSDYLDSPWSRMPRKTAASVAIFKRTALVCSGSFSRILEVHGRDKIVGETQTETEFWPGVRVRCHLTDYYTRTRECDSHAVHALVSKPADARRGQQYKDGIAEFLSGLPVKHLIDLSYNSKKSKFSFTPRHECATVDDSSSFSIWFKGLTSTDAAELFLNCQNCLVDSFKETESSISQLVTDFEDLPRVFGAWNENFGGASWTSLNVRYTNGFDPFTTSTSSVEQLVFPVFANHKDKGVECTVFAVHENGKVFVEIVADKSDVIARLMEDTGLECT